MTTPTLTTAIDNAQRDIIRAALVEHRGNVTATAVALGTSADTLHRRIRDLGLREWLTATYPRSVRRRRKA